MQARIVSAARGARWLAEGWRLFRVSPLRWLVLAFAYLFFTNVLSLIPYLGIALALVLVPPLTVGYMAAGRAAAHGSPVQLEMLTEGFRSGLRAQLVCSLLIFAAVSFADEHGALRSILGGRPPAADFQPGHLVAPVALFAVLYTPVMMMFWFAPPLAAWHSSGVAKALFYSFFACLMNWRAFVAYGAAAALLVVVFPFVSLTVLGLLSGSSFKVPVISLAFPLLIVLLPTLFASFYASYRDVFGVEKE